VGDCAREGEGQHHGDNDAQDCQVGEEEARTDQVADLALQVKAVITPGTAFFDLPIGFEQSLVFEAAEQGVDIRFFIV